MKPVRLSNHARLQMTLRGASEEEVTAAINKGVWKQAKLGKSQTKHCFEFDNIAPSNQKFYRYKTVEPVFAEEDNELVVVTVKVYYSNEEDR